MAVGSPRVPNMARRTSWPASRSRPASPVEMGSAEMGLTREGFTGGEPLRSRPKKWQRQRRQAIARHRRLSDRSGSAGDDPGRVAGDGARAHIANDGNQNEVFGLHGPRSRKSGSHETRCWREMDSNHRSPVADSIFRDPPFERSGLALPRERRSVPPKRKGRSVARHIDCARLRPASSRRSGGAWRGIGSR
jgi:hypothetical protein